jgi:hypothetical protein
VLRSKYLVIFEKPWTSTLHSKNIFPTITLQKHTESLFTDSAIAFLGCDEIFPDIKFLYMILFVNSGNDHPASFRPRSLAFLILSVLSSDFSAMARDWQTDAGTLLCCCAHALRIAVRRTRCSDSSEAEEIFAAFETLVVVQEKSREACAVGACCGAYGRAAVLSAFQLEIVARAESVCCAGSAS